MTEYVYKNQRFSDPAIDRQIDELVRHTNATLDSILAHAALTEAHGATGAVVGTTNVQTLTNKTLTDPVIAKIVSPADLEIDCGASKTLKLLDSVWDDIQFAISGAKVPAANFPNWETFTANTSEYSFAVNDYIDLSANEMAHWWKEGTDARIHLHATTKAANASGSDRFAKFTVWVSYADVDAVWVEVPVTAELTIPTGTAALTHKLLSVGTVSLPGLKVGTQVKIRIKRIAATGGTEYPGNIFITQVGVHAEKDTMGSRTVGAK
jgi:hypothetical protein